MSATGKVEGPFESPWFGELTAAESRQLLARSKVARLAYVLSERVDIVPIHIVCWGENIYGRTSAGSRLSNIPEGTMVALQTDEHRGPFDWLSVVVHGGFSMLNAEALRAGDPAELEIVARLFEGVASDWDPVPFRNQIFRIHASEITGRYAQPTGARRREPTHAGMDGSTPKKTEAGSNRSL